MKSTVLPIWKKLRITALAAAFTTGLAMPVRALQIIPQFDSSILSDPQSATIQQTIRAAIAFYEANFTDPVTVNIRFTEMTSGLGESGTVLQTNSYASYWTALTARASSADDATALAHLPPGPGNPVNGDPGITLKRALGRLLGLPGNDYDYDSTISLNTSLMNLSASISAYDSTKYSMYSTVAHEMDEALGFGSALDRGTAGPVTPEDLFRYDLAGARSFNTNELSLAYFSLDGQNRLAQFNQDSAGDFGDWFSEFAHTPQVQDAFGTPGARLDPGVELRVMDVLGYTRGPGSIWLDFSFPTIGNLNAGTFDLPLNNLLVAAAVVPSRGTVLIKSSTSTAAPIRLTPPLRLVAANGPVHIGP